MTTTIITNFQTTQRPAPPSLGFSSVLYSPTMKDDPSDEILNGDKRSAHNALERQRREGLNNKFQQLAHVLPGLQNVRRPSKSMIVSKSLEFVSKSMQRDSSYQNKIKQLRKEYQTLRKHALQQQQQQQQVSNKKVPTSLSLATTNKKRAHQHQPTSPLKRQKQPTSVSPPVKKQASPIRHKFVHHHASASSPSSCSPEKKHCPAPQSQPQPQPQSQQAASFLTPYHTMVATTTSPPVFHEFAIQPSWPPLDLSGTFMDYPPQQTTYSIPFCSTTTEPQPSYYPADASYACLWK